MTERKVFRFCARGGTVLAVTEGLYKTSLSFSKTSPLLGERKVLPPLRGEVAALADGEVKGGEKQSLRRLFRHLPLHKGGFFLFLHRFPFTQGSRERKKPTAKCNRFFYLF